MLSEDALPYFCEACYFDIFPFNSIDNFSVRTEFMIDTSSEVSNNIVTNDITNNMKDLAHDNSQYVDFSSSFEIILKPSFFLNTV